jgi:AdoMet-dependent heme synthase
VTSRKHDDHPFIAIWETTQACDLVCLHCRACARPERDARELSTAEGKRLLESFARGRVPLVVLTGGDPAKRPDLVELVAHGKSLGLIMGLTPSATPLVTPELIAELASVGLGRLAISIDGPVADLHESFRGISGSFDHSLRILAEARRHGIATQVNTTVHSGSIGRLREMAALVEQTTSVLWSVFFLVPTGRADARMLPSPEAVEAALLELAEIADAAPFAVKTTAAPHYRRVLVQRKQARGKLVPHGVHGSKAVRINDGRGFMFVSHLGECYPSGFLPIPCGNVRSEDPIEIYRNHETFRLMREPDLLTGKCGACEYRHLCGGSRARAYALTGDPLASDPVCAFVPPGWVADEPEPAPKRFLALLDA